VQTYLTTGNVSFAARPAAVRGIARKAEAAIGEVVGRRTEVFVRTVDELLALQALDPFRVAPLTVEHERIVAFLDHEPAVTLPIPKKAGYAKFKNPASRFAIVGVFVAQTAGGVRVAVTGAGANGVFRVKAMEEALSKSWSPDAIKDMSVPAGDLQTDLHASAEYRAHLVSVMALRAVAAAQ